MRRIVLLLLILVGLAFADKLVVGNAYIISAIGIKNAEGTVVYQSGDSNALSNGTYKLAPQVIIYDGKSYVGAATPFTGCLNGTFYNQNGAPDGKCFTGGNATTSSAGLMSAADKAKINNVYTKDEIEQKFTDFVDTIYPVGSIYMSASPRNPSELFGGTWEALDEGRVLIGANSTYPAGSVGGEAKHTLTVGEMPSHDHQGYMHMQGDSSWSGKLYSQYTIFSKEKYTYDSEARDLASGQIGYKSTDGNSSINHVIALATALTSTSGSSQPHNNMQPYLSVYMWKRTG